MKSVEYWKRRAEARMYEELEKAEDTAGIIAKVYAKAARYLMDKAEHVFDRFKITECLTKEEALSLIGSLSNVEDTEELIRKLEADGSEEAQETLKRLRNTGAYGSRIQRLGEMLKQVNKIMTSVYGQELKEVTGVLSEIASDSYLKTIYDLQQRINTGFSVAHIDQKRIDKILRMNWSGEHFSKRIWNNTQKLGQTVKEQILEGALTGKTEREMADEIAQEFGKGAKVARRLVRTESCHVSSEVNAEAYEDSDIEMYLYLATLDLRTSEVCRELDGKRFPVSDRQVGENYPPMHPWCRSTTIAIVDEEYLKDMKRTYRDPETGRNEKVPLTMNYNEWYKRFVDGTESTDRKGPIPLSRIHVNKEDQLYKNLQKLKPYKDYEDFAIHSAKDLKTVEYVTTAGKSTFYSAKEYAKIIQDDDSYRGGKVRLLSCGMGSDGTTFAQELANNLGKEVIAPTETLWTNEDGELFVTNSRHLAEMWYDGVKVNQSGRWKVFVPE